MTILRGGYGICKVKKGSTADFQRCFRKDCFGSPFHFFYAGVAQLAERLLCKQWVGGSRPSTGSTRLITSPVPPNDKKTPYPKGYGAPWQRVKDSNPHIQSQSLLCYLYTNPLYSFVRVARTGIIIPENKNLSRFFLKKIIFVDFSRFQGIFSGKPPLRVHHQKQISLFRK